MGQAELPKAVLRCFLRPCGFFDAWFLGKPGIVDFGGPDGPDWRKTHSKQWAAKRPSGWRGFLHQRGPLDPTIDDLGSAPKHRPTTIPNDAGPISACFDDDPKFVNWKIAQLSY